MFTSKGLFSEITCPYNESCVLPNCLFAHPKPLTPGSSIRDGSAIPENTLDGVKNDEGGQRKRRKVESPRGIISNLRVENVKPILKSNTGHTSVSRTISPPPLRRQAEIAPKPSILPTATPSDRPPKPVHKLPPQTPPKIVKVETLNPRLLKHSPATHDIRYRLLQALHEQISRLNIEVSKDADKSNQLLVLSDQEVIKMALELEESFANDKPAIYPNMVKNKILVYKRMTVENWKIERRKAQEEAVAPEVKDSLPSKTPESPKPIETGLTEAEELEFLPKLYTSLTGMSKHGYVTEIPSEKSVADAKNGVEAAKGWEVCDRCKVRFQVFPGRREVDGALTSGGSCTYHWGKPIFPDKDPNDPKAKRERKYRCCSQLIGDSTGCTSAETHIFKVSEVKRLAAIMNFAETPPNDNPSKTPVCIDGEMGYTVYGLELIRLTATSWPSGEELLDVLVRPIGETLDLNSRWSGVWPQQMADAIPWDSSIKPTDGKLRIVSSPGVARDLLFSHLSPATPLIGHGLENDLNAVRIIHPTIIDTCLLYPHKAGLPFRNGLKMLMQLHLNRTIQTQKVVDGKMEGHDSKEDARAAGDLVRFKIAERWNRMKIEGWKLEDGKFIAPTSVLEAPINPKGLLTVEFLEGNGNQDTSAKTGSKRSIAEISGIDFEDGEILNE